MPYTPVQLFATQTLPTSATTLYPAGIVTRIDRLAFSNPSGSPVTVTVYLVPSGGTAGAANQVGSKMLNTGEAWTAYDAVVNQVLKPGDFLACAASTAGAVVVTGAGTQIS